MKFTTRVCLATLGASVLVLAGCSDNTGPESRASYVRDPVGDFIPSFDGVRNADLDARTMEVTYSGFNTFVFNATVAGNVGLTPGAVYVWGVNRGAGTARFGSIATGVLFDLVVIVNPTGTSIVRDFITNTATNLPASSVTVSGSNIEVRVPAGLMPTQGFALPAYTSNFWPRTGVVSNNQIADFAPDNNNVPVRVQ